MKIKLDRYRFSPPSEGQRRSRSTPKTPEEHRERMANAFDRVARREVEDLPPGLAALLSTSSASDATARGYGGEELEGVPAPIRTLALGFRSPFLPRFVKDGMRVLDAGCGGGLDLHMAARQVGAGGFLAGVDISEEMILLARNFTPRGVASTYEVAPVEELPQADGSFDAVVLNCCLSLVPDRRAALAEVSRVLDDQGVLLLTDLVTLRGLDADLLEALSGWGSAAGSAPPRVELRSDLEDAGFKPVDIEEHIFDRARLQTMARVVADDVPFAVLRKAIEPIINRLSGRLAVIFVAARRS